MVYAMDRKSSTMNESSFLSQLCIMAVAFYVIVIFPIGNIAYALAWKSNFQAYILYSSKIFLFIPCTAYVLLNFKETIFKKRHKLYPVISIILISTLVGIYHGNARSEPFYFFSDVAGSLYSMLLILLIFNDAAQSDERIEYWINTIIIGMATTSVSVIFNYYALDGAKRWAPPEMELGITFALTTFLVRKRAGAFLYVAIALLITATYLSELRTSMAILFAVFLVTTIHSIVTAGISKRLCVRFVSVCAITVAVVMLTNTGILESRLSSTAIVLDGPEQVQVSFRDASANQRLVEARIVLKELRGSIVNWIFGKGAGATFANDGTFSHYSERVHNVHSTPAALLFRTGSLGLALYSFILLWAAVMILTKDSRQFKLALAAASVLASLLLNQFFYWGTFMALGVGLLAAHRVLLKKQNGQLKIAPHPTGHCPKGRNAMRNA